VIAALGGLRHRLLHGLAVVTVEGVALDGAGVDLLAAEYVLEGPRHRGRAGARGARDRNDRVCDGHDFLRVVQAEAPACMYSDRVLNSGELNGRSMPSSCSR